MQRHQTGLGNRRSLDFLPGPTLIVQRTMSYHRPDPIDAPPPEPDEHIVVGHERLTIRPICAGDAHAHGEFFRRLTPEDLRFRFFTAVRELPPAAFARLTSVDHVTETAFIGVRDSTGETVGVARLARLPSLPEGEFALVVQPDMKHKGLASELMHRLVGWARRQGLRAIVGQVLADNVQMLEFARHFGFRLSHQPDESDVIDVRLTLG
jgi:acetyltransferase